MSLNRFCFKFMNIANSLPVLVLAGRGEEMAELFDSYWNILFMSPRAQSRFGLNFKSCLWGSETRTKTRTKRERKKNKLFDISDTIYCWHEHPMCVCIISNFLSPSLLPGNASLILCGDASIWKLYLQSSLIHCEFSTFDWSSSSARKAWLFFLLHSDTRTRYFSTQESWPIRIAMLENQAKKNTNFFKFLLITLTKL